MGDVWGIGRRHEKRLTAMGVRTAYDFSVLPREWVRRNGRRRRPPLARDERDALHQSSGTGAARQAGDMHVAGIRENDSDFNEVKAAVVRYLAPRPASSATSIPMPGASTSASKPILSTSPSVRPSGDANRIPVPTDNTFEMVPYAMTLLRAIWPAYARRTSVSVQTRYTVTLSDLISAEALQLNMFIIDPTSGSCGVCRLRWTRSLGPLNLDSRLVVLGAELTGQNNTRLRREMLQVPHDKVG